MKINIRENKPVIELAVITAVLVVLEYILKEAFNKDLYSLFPIILLILFYIFINNRISKLEDLLKIHVSDIVYIEGSEAVDLEFIKAIKEAQEIIMTTGGKSRSDRYLSAIENRLLEKGNIEYYRIISTKRITSLVYEHLSKTIERNGVYVSFAQEIMIPSLLLTENVAFICLPEPEPSKLRTCMKITDKEIIDTFEKYVRIWNGKGEKLTNNDDLKGIFAESIEKV